MFQCRNLWGNVDVPSWKELNFCHVIFPKFLDVLQKSGCLSCIEILKMGRLNQHKVLGLITLIMNIDIEDSGTELGALSTKNETQINRVSTEQSSIMAFINEVRVHFNLLAILYTEYINAISFTASSFEIFFNGSIQWKLVPLGFFSILKKKLKF